MPVITNSRHPSILRYLIIASFSFLTACGNGGGGDDGGGGNGGGTSISSVAVSSSSAMSSSSSSSIAPLVADPGPNLSVNMGDTITLNPHAVVANASGFNSANGNLEVTGTSTNPMDIVKISWTLVSGPAPTLVTSSTTSASATFVAPSTEGAASVDIVYKLKLTRQDGQTAEANVTFTIKKVNQAPAANAGSTNTVKGLTAVTLSALGTDSDGTITSYAWTQLSGTPVSLSAPNASTTSFTAPSTTNNIDLTFQVEVADSDGAKTTSQVLIHVTPENAPQVALHFPPATGVYKESTISAFGDTTVTGATINSVTVDIGAGPVAATVNPDGTWRVDNLTVPSVATSFTLNVTVTDSLSRTGTTTSVLSKSAKSNGTGQTWKNATGVAIDTATNTAYVLAIGSFLSEVRVFPIDLSNGNRGSDVSNFSYASQGIRSTAFQRLAYDETNHTMYVSVFPASTQLQRQIVSINTATGMRNLVSDSSRGTGAAFIAPAGLAIGKDGNLFVADFNAEAIVSVDIATGNRTDVADTATNAYGMALPTDLAFDDGQNKLYVATALSPLVIFGLDMAADPVTSFLVSNAPPLPDQDPSPIPVRGTGLPIAPVVSGLAIDKSRQQLFTIDRFNRLFSVDIATGNRAHLLTFANAKGTDSFHINSLAFDQQKHVIYALEQTAEMSLTVVDPVTGQKVILSGAAL